MRRFKYFKIFLTVLAVCTVSVLSSETLRDEVCIMKIVDHDALNKTVQGIRNALASRNVNIRVESAQGNRAIVAVCFMYDACLFNPPGRNQWNAPVVDAVEQARSAGVEFWQLNFEISPTALRISRLDRIFTDH